MLGPQRAVAHVGAGIIQDTFLHMSGRHLAGAGPSLGLPARAPACTLSRYWISSQHGGRVPSKSLKRAEWKHMHFYDLALSQSIASGV